MKALVIGGAGFLGSHVADTLSERGLTVSVFDRKPSAYHNPAHKMIVGDMTDTASLEEAIEGQDYVFLFAGMADIKEAHYNPCRAIELNVLSVAKIMELCVKYNIKRFIFASSVYVYSAHGSFYKASKQCAEIIIESFYEEYKLPYSILRYGSLYGPRANHFNFIHNAIRQALIEKKINRQGDGAELRDYIHVKDAAVATVNEIDAAEGANYLMLTGNQTLKVRDVLAMISEILNNEVEVEYLPGEMEGHYQITPYSFRPKVAKKVVLESYHDLGQGILECIHEIHDQLNETKENA